MDALPGEPSPLSPGDTVDHFQIVRLLGQGGAGDVWLARDQVLGRKVALKMLRTMAEGTALNDLLDEARATAKVMHPHVVTVYAVGSVDGAPYLALEFVDGVTLRQRLRERPTSTPEALRLGRDIASALACAHGQGVLHLDLKPDNVLCGHDGRIRVVDFGLARLHTGGRLEEVPGASIVGTPGWMAPEIWRGDVPTEAADAWAFGVVLCELLTHELPYPHTRISELVQALYSPRETPLPQMPADVAGEVRALLVRLLHKDARARPSMVEVVAVLEAALARPTSAVVADENPYRGLDAFREVDAARYFGREPEIESFVSQLSSTPFVPIVGHSGAGKSSFVRAGVIPRLRESEPWLVVELRPGPRPFVSLARALRQARAQSTRRPSSSSSSSSPPSSSSISSAEFPTIGDLSDQGDGIEVTETGSGGASPRPSDVEVTEPVRLLAATLSEAPERLYLELGALAKESGAKVLLFVDQLEEAETLSADERTTQRFLHALAAAADDVADPVRVVVTLRDDFLGRLAAVEALRGAFGRVTVLRRPSLSGLVESIISPLFPTGVSFDDGSLPLEMARAVEHEPSALPLLSFTCAALWEQRDVEKKRLLRSVYTRLGGVVGALATHADAVLDGLSPSQQSQARGLLLGLVTAERTRRRRSRRELLEAMDAGAGVVLDRLIGARLLTAERGQRDDDSEIELAHEALVRTWGRLARFLDEEREKLDFAAELEQVAEVWARRGRRTSEVWTGPTLHEALARVERVSVLLPEKARLFLEEGRREDRRRQRQRRVVVAGVFSALLMVALSLFVARSRAVAAAHEAQEARAIAEREAAEAAFAKGDVWGARAKLRTSLEIDDSEGARALWRRLRDSNLAFFSKLSGAVVDGAFAADDSMIAAQLDNRIVVCDAPGLLPRDNGVMQQAGVSINAVAVMADRALVGLRDDGRVVLVDLVTGERLRILDLHQGGVESIVALPSRQSFVSAGRDGQLHVVTRDGAVGEPLLVYPRTLRRVIVEPGERRLWALTADAALVEVSLSPGGEEQAPIALGVDGRDLVVAADGSVLIGAVDGALVRVDPARRVHPVGQIPRVNRLALDPTRGLLAVRAVDGDVSLWKVDANRVKPVALLEVAGLGGYGALAMNAAGTRLLTANRTGELRVWRIDDDALRDRLEPPAPYNDVAISGDGSRVAEQLEDGIAVRDVASGDLVGFVPMVERVSAFALDTTGRRVVVGVQQRINLHDLEQPGVVSSPLDGTMHAAIFLTDGSVVAATDRALLRVEPSSPLRITKRAWEHQPVSLAASPDGARMLVGAATGTAWLIDTASLTELRRFTVDDGYSVTGVAFSPDGARATLLTSAAMEVRDVRTGALVRRFLSEHISGACAGFLPDGRVLDLRVDGAVAVWPDDGVEQALPLVPPTGSCQVAAGRVAMRLGDYVIPYDLVSGAPAWLARGVVGDVVSTHRTALPFEALDRRVLGVHEAPRHLCSAEVGGAFVMRSRDGSEVIARASDPMAWPFVVASATGCVWRTDTTLVRLRPSASGGSVDVVHENVVTVGGGDGVVVAVTVDGRLLLVDVEGGRSTNALQADGLSLDESVVIGVNEGHLALASPAGVIALWTLSSPDAAPAVVKVAHTSPWSVTPLGAGLVALGTEERIVVVQMASRAVLLDEPSRGAVEVVAGLHDGPADAPRLRLQIGTNLGGSRTFDLSPLVADRCAVLRDVWATSPVTWERGQAMLRPPPNDHPCALETTTTANSTTTTTAMTRTTTTSITATPLVPAP